MQALYNLLDFLFNAYATIVLARVWLQFARADFYNPLSQFVVKATQPIVGPVRRMIPSIGAFDTGTFLIAYLVIFIKLVLFSVMFGSGIPNLLSVAIVSIFGLLKTAFYLLFVVLIVRMILSFVSQGNPMQYVLHQLTEPMLAPIRRVLPVIGGLDFSPLVLILGIQFLLSLMSQYIGI
ncbi:YggT family protein [Glaciecola sp. MH2013]|uniref:YggT family protein n=1 Tax=Glaciecola sp. MH2013 TaxID=2785524 RepID=UPI00189EC895|nr:YggT family protein [Glaciecola sp. MH2013]MBF7071994.1 YggT family protein [Glaciecola sp. MH2013]